MVLSISCSPTPPPPPRLLLPFSFPPLLELFTLLPPHLSVWESCLFSYDRVAAAAGIQIMNITFGV